jgi:hypothetical protein
MDKTPIHYGVLTTFNFTWFVRRTGVRELQISKAFEYDATIESTILQILAHLVIDSSRLGPCPYVADFDTGTELGDGGNYNNDAERRAIRMEATSDQSHMVTR